MDRTLGTVELDLEIKHMNALTGVDVSDYEWKFNPCMQLLRAIMRER
jgi:hypothetical protein